MKCMAARVGGTNGQGLDIPDIVFLIQHLGLMNARAVLDLVGQFYLENRITMRARHLIEGLFAEGSVTAVDHE